MKKQFIIYCSYPYSDNPQKRTDEINARCRVIYQKAHMTANDLLLLIPHNIFDAVFDFPEGASNFWMPLCELTLILRCDALAYDPNAISPGVVWEKAFAELNEIPIFTYDELLSGKRPNVTSKLRFRKDVSEVRALKSGATQMQNNAEKWRWLAWSIAWEGCISLGQGSCGKDKKYKIFCPLIQIANTEKELLDQVLEIVEVGTINSSKSKKRENDPRYKDKWVWRVKGKKNLVIILENILPYMPSIRKKEVAKLLLEYCKRQGRGRLTKREYEISEKIHLLNHKGKIRFRKMRTFGTGATRDSVNGKPDFEGYLSPIVIEAYGAYMLKHQTQADGKIRGSDNWMLGIPKEQYIKSAWRHFLDVWLEQRGYKSRDGLDEALGGLLFNVMGYWFEVLKARALALRAEAQK